MCLPLLAPLGAALGASASSAAAVGTMAALSIAASAAGAGMGFVGQKQAADSQRYQYDQTQRLANENLQIQYQQMAVRSREEQIAKSQQVQEIQAQAEQAFGSIRTEAGEAGIQGNSVNSLMGEFARQQNESLANLDINYDFRNRQLYMEQLGMRGQAESSMIRAYPNQTAPSIATPLLQTGASVLNTVGMYGNLEKMPMFGGGSSPQVGQYSSIARRDSFVNSLSPYYRNINRGWY
jgi:hypothetical protein